MSTTPDASRPRLLVIASTFPAKHGDGTPSFVSDLAGYEAAHFTTLVLVPRVPGGLSHEQLGDFRVDRFPYFFRRWETLADGAILENMRADPWSSIQVPSFLVAEISALRRVVRRFKPDVLHIHWMVPQGLAALVAARDIPWVVTTLGGDVYALRGRLWRAAKSQVLRRAAAVTTMNLDMRDRLVALGAPRERTSVLPMGVDLERVRSAGEGAAREPGRILFAGRLVEKKGVAFLLQALARIPSRIDWSVDIVGDGPLRPELEALASGLPRPVRFLGQQTREELALSMHRADVVAVPSITAGSGDQDGLPVTLLEAMAAGCAIVASRLAGIDEAIEDDVSGILVPPGDTDALAKALAQLLEDPSRRAALGAAAAGTAERYSIRSIADRYVALLQEAAARS